MQDKAKPKSKSPIEPIPGDSRLTAFPISREGIWAYYKDAQRCFWTPVEVDLSKDRDDYKNKLNDSEKRFIDYVLAFFASLDKLVNVNITERFKGDISIFEVDCFYDLQVAIENIHSEMYSLLLDTIISDENKKKHLLNSVTEIPVIEEMGKWIHECIDSKARFGERLLRMACVEGIFFIGAFCAIYWLQNKPGGLMKGLTQSNELISKDESLHTMFSIYLYTLLVPEAKIPQSQIVKIFKDAVKIASDFITEALPNNLAEMNSSLMITYIECSADNLITLLGLEPIYKSRNPFHFMEKFNLPNRTNFFERRVTEYAKPENSDQSEFETVENF